MKWLLFAVLIFLIPVFAGSVVREPPVERSQWTQEAKIWTARSCVGEAGFEAYDECVAIAWVYAVRAKISKSKPYVQIVREYSAAIKDHEGQKRPWVLELNEDLRKPPSWPDNVNWQRWKPQWARMLNVVHFWGEGYLPNQLPNADHYGSRADAYRAAHVRRWRRLEAPDYFRNWFFNSRRLM